MIEFFKIILYEPLLNLLVVFYNLIPGHDLGIAIIILTLVLKLLLFPLSRKSIKSQKALKDLQPKLEELKKKYVNQKDKQAQAMMSLYKENKVNPFSSCLPLLIQLPILIAVFQVFRVGLSDSSLPIYSFIHNPGTLNIMAFGILDLAKASPILALVTGILQYLQMKAFTTEQPDKKVIKQSGAKDENMMATMNKQMKFMMPALTVFIGITLPSGLMLYWLASLLFTILEQKLVFASSKQTAKS
ncbi:YidC/Oxa1 family membrane protein insertase [Patescibacteria group bacterium]|nr:YidC/Oxa1 family membrane protein insertase [Patescibacteria group bacterium]